MQDKQNLLVGRPIDLMISDSRKLLVQGLYSEIE